MNIQAMSVQYPLETFSVMDIFTLKEFIKYACNVNVLLYAVAHNVTSQPSQVFYDRQVQLTCHHHDITDTISRGPILQSDQSCSVDEGWRED